MSAQTEVRDVERWLLRNGFVELPRKTGGHRYFGKGGLKITLPGHGPKDLSRKITHCIKRALRANGYEVETFT